MGSQGITMDAKKFSRALSRYKFDRKSFEILYKYYFPRIAFHINQKFRTNCGEDIAQQFFVKLYTYEYKDKIESPTTWVFQICDHLMIDRLRKDKRLLFIEEVPAAAYEAPGGEGVSWALMQLNENMREAIVMHYFEGYSLKEIAELKQVKYCTIKQRHNRGIKKMKEIVTWVYRL